MQILNILQTISKNKEVLTASNDLQFILQPNVESFAVLQNSMEALLKSGQLEEIATIATNFGSLK